MTWRDTFAALKHRNYRLFFAGQLVSLTGSWMQNTAQGWLVYQLTGSKVLLGTVAAVGSQPLLLLSVWGGSLADRHPKRTVIFFTQTGMMLLALAFAALVWSGRIQPWHILVLAALGGVAMAFDMPARQAFTVEMTSRKDLMNAISPNSSIFNGALLSANGVGALLGALTVATYGSHVRPRLMIFGGLWLFSAMLLLLAVVRWFPLVLACLAVGGWGMLLYFSTTNTLVQTSVSDAMRGRVMGIWALVFGGLMPLGGLESGLLSHAVGVPWTVAAGALICAGAGLEYRRIAPARCLCLQRSQMLDTVTSVWQRTTPIRVVNRQ